MNRTIAFLAMVTGLLYPACRVQPHMSDRSPIRLHGAIVRGDTTARKLALVFTGDEFGDGATFIAGVLARKQVKASFFLTGNFYRNHALAPVIRALKNDGHYLGSHSDRHLLYCDWQNRDSLLVTRQQFAADLLDSYRELSRWHITSAEARYFLPPYEWYNDSIAAWTRQLGLELISFTPGTRSNADYTYPEMGSRYLSSEQIFQSIITYEQRHASGLNGFVLLLHIGTDSRRTDKFYWYLPRLIEELHRRHYRLVTVPELLDS